MTDSYKSTPSGTSKARDSGSAGPASAQPATPGIRTQLLGKPYAEQRAILAPQDAGPVQAKEAAQAPEVVGSTAAGREILFAELTKQLRGHQPPGMSEEQYGQAILKIGEGLAATAHGQKLIELLTTKKVLPLTLTGLAAVLAAMAASNSDIPATPGIPLGDLPGLQLGDLKLKVEPQGTWQQPTGFTISFGGTLGKTPESARPEEAKAAAPTLPAEVVAHIESLNDQLLTDWIVKAATDDREFAGPDEEATMKERLEYARTTFGGGGVGKLGARAVARQVAAGIQQMAAHRGSPRVDLEYELAFVTSHDRKTLKARLDELVKGVASKMADKAAAVPSVRFACERAAWSHSSALR